MILSQISKQIFAITGAALAGSAMMFSAANAQVGPNSGAYYKAELTTPAAKQKELIRGVFVKCDGTSCRAPIASSAAKNMCLSIAREFGAVSAFSVGDRSFTPAEIEKCNGAKKTQVAKK
jgi:hypothetical protein